MSYPITNHKETSNPKARHGQRTFATIHNMGFNIHGCELSMCVTVQTMIMCVAPTCLPKGVEIVIGVPEAKLLQVTFSKLAER